MIEYWKLKPNSLCQEADQIQVFSVQYDYLVYTNGINNVYHIPLSSSRILLFSATLWYWHNRRKKLDAATIRMGNTSQYLKENQAPFLA